MMFGKRKEWGAWIALCSKWRVRLVSDALYIRAGMTGIRLPRVLAAALLLLPFCLGASAQTLADGSARGTIALSLNTESCTVEVESSELVDGELIVTKRSACAPAGSGVWAVYCEGGCNFTTYRAYKEIYGVKDGNLALLRTIEGKIVPAQSERVEWPDDTGSITFLGRTQGAITLPLAPLHGEVLDLRNVWLEPEGALSAGAHTMLLNTKKRVRSRKAR